jgi:hypothetical protein
MPIPLGSGNRSSVRMNGSTGRNIDEKDQLASSRSIRRRAVKLADLRVCAPSVACAMTMLGSIPSSRCQTTCVRLGRSANDGRKSSISRTSIPAGGARRDRTDDLLLAKQALSQLSYGPCLGTVDQVSAIRMPMRRFMMAAPDYRLPTTVA